MPAYSAVPSKDGMQIDAAIAAAASEERNGRVLHSGKKASLANGLQQRTAATPVAAVRTSGVHGAASFGGEPEPGWTTVIMPTPRVGGPGAFRHDDESAPSLDTQRPTDRFGHGASVVAVTQGDEWELC